MSPKSSILSILPHILQKVKKKSQLIKRPSRLWRGNLRWKAGSP